VLHHLALAVDLPSQPLAPVEGRVLEHVLPNPLVPQRRVRSALWWVVVGGGGWWWVVVVVVVVCKQGTVIAGWWVRGELTLVCFS
jgi:hypothetical protein